MMYQNKTNLAESKLKEGEDAAIGMWLLVGSHIGPG